MALLAETSYIPGGGGSTLESRAVGFVVNREVFRIGKEGMPPTARQVPARPGLMNREVRVRISQPESGVRFLRDPETPLSLSTLALSAVVDPPVPQVVWFVDGAPWKVADFPYTVRWPALPGVHTFEARLPHATVTSARVEVQVE